MRAGFVPRIDLVEIIYKGVDDEILFAGPMTFKKSDGKGSLALDLTTEFLNKKSDSVTFKYTISSRTNHLNFSRFEVISTDTLFTLSATHLMFKEPHNNDFHYRYSFTTTYANLQKVLNAKAPLIVLDSQHVYKASRRWAKDASEINKKILLITQGYL